MPLLLLLALACVLALPSAASGQTSSPFERVTLLEGLDQPTAVAFAPDGRMFVAEKEGRVRVVSAAGALRAAPLLDISEHVNNYIDRGLLGIAVDAQYPTHPYLYLLYVREHAPHRPSGIKRSVLTRVTVDADNNVGPEEVILGGGGNLDVASCDGVVDCIPATDGSHTIGTVRSAPDGTLYVGNGDSLWPGWHVGSSMSMETYSPDSYRGKILHVNRDGSPVEGHPYCPGETEGRCAKILAMGFRNPFRFSLRPTGGGLTVGDVGLNSWEEMNIVRGPGNHGWPCWEGNDQTGNYRDTQRCQDEYEKGRGAFRFPNFWYFNRAAPEDPGASIVGGPTYTGTDYPDGFKGEVMYADTVRGWVRSVRFNSSNSVIGQRHLLPEGSLVYTGELVQGPASMEGDLVAVEVGSGRVSRIRYAPNDRTPIAVADANPRHGSDVDTIEFSSAGSHDPLGQQPLSFHWDFGDGSESNEPNPEPHTYATPGAYVALLTVTDPSGRSAKAQVPIFPGFDPPEVDITKPAAGLAFDAGDRIELEGSATDPDEDEDTHLTGRSLVWNVQLHHNDHVHYLGRFRGGTASFNTTNGHDADSWYEVTLTATDERGLATTARRVLRPRTTTVALRSEPPGAPVTYDGRQNVAPWDITAARGFRAPISAGAEFVAEGRIWRFARWSNEGDQVQVVEIPDDGITLTAFYDDAGPAPSDAETPPPPGVFEPPPSPFGFPRDVRGPVVRLRTANARRLTGIVTDAAGVAGVRIALRRGGKRRCRFVGRRTARLTKRRSCRSPVWRSAKLGAKRGSTRRWKLKLGGRLRRGRYAALVRASDTLGNVSERWGDGKRATRVKVVRRKLARRGRR